METLNKSALALAVALAAQSAVAGDPPVYTRNVVDPAVRGAAFVVAGNVLDNPRPEIVVAAFGQFQFNPTVIPAAGTVSLYRNAQPGNRPNGQITAWEKIEIIRLSDGITFPNRPTLTDVDGDGAVDVIVPGGYFFDTFPAPGFQRGSITWWQNKGNGKRWIRHDVVTDSAFSYHSVLFEDFDGDGIKDMVTVAEEAGNPGDIADDKVELQIFRGLGGGQFGPAEKIGDGGGALLTAWDVNGNGLLDIVSPQFFGMVGAQPFVPPFARDASVASFVWFENLGDGTFAKHAIGTAQGPGFTIIPVPDLLGDGVTRWIATNHTNKNIPFPPFALYPAPAVYEFTPGLDPRQPWFVRQLSDDGDFPVTGGPGQAAPGAAAVGDLNGNGRLDIAVAGDGSRAVYWMEQQADGTFITRQLPDSTGYGQNGGPVVIDLNRSGTNEIVFSSFDRNDLSIWSR
jgi:hypothetical protein